MGQLDCMSFYREDRNVSEEVKKKMKFCPLTNSGCESNFGDITQTLKKVGGSINIEKLSDMHMVKRNKYFDSKKWSELSDEEKRDKWKRARNSEESLAIRKVGEDFLSKVEGMK